ncbi:hypothetical protein [Cellulomonas terrae]|uniref:Uncharacterized protein n=1 Tax=Cellulomonas terrae TaxID=311234 RepID=A0A511JHE5_9CELL|nr:hypothetical protein [Cellulomonas terrae]GEL97421.1 hypothetical protein CTE05_09680 [Cellulomonas terrae]
MDQSTQDELAARINADESHFAGVLPREYVIAWRAYLAGLLEWGVLDVASHTTLVGRLPPVDDDPSVAILLGRDED